MTFSKINSSINSATKESDDPPKANRNDVVKAHKKMIQVALADAGWWCYGVKAIEVWVYTREGNLEMKEGNSWLDPSYLKNHDSDAKKALNSIYDTTSRHRQEIHRNSYAPGVGLPGTLWTDTFGMKFTSIQNKRPSGARSPLSRSSLSLKTDNSYINWRNLPALTEDPDQPYDPRMFALARAGLRQAAGIPFNVRGSQGIVIFMTRESAKLEKLSSRLNEEYLVTATEHIGSVQALFESREDLALERSKQVKKSFQKARRLIRCFMALQSRDEPEESFVKERKEDPTCVDKLKQNSCRLWDASQLFLQKWYKKMLGADIPPPPRLPLNVCIFILFAAFFTDFIMFSINQKFKDAFGNGLGFEPGQIASATTMIYALTASPAAQPRSIILGHGISMCVGMTFAHIPGNNPNLGEGDPFDSIRDLLRLSASVSISTTLMAIAGVAHPPGGAISLIFLRYKWNQWKSIQKFGIILIQDMILIILASIFNNLHSAKSYPTYWGYLPNRITSSLRKTFSKKK